MDLFPRRKRLPSNLLKLRQKTDTFAWGKTPASDEQLWPEFIRRIREGKVVPVISNWFRVNQVFDIDADNRLGLSAEMTLNGETNLTIDEELAELWADEIDYPLPDKHRLARVALYNRVRAYDTEQANANYIDFLKRCLLSLATADEALTGQIDLLRTQIDDLSFSDIAAALSYPRFVEIEDPLCLLARLPLPLYVTTSHHDFMERALQTEGKNPRTQICFWAGEPLDVVPEHHSDPSLVPSIEAPVVYHLFGLERYPASLVLSEDDYLQFLIKISQRTDWDKGTMPLYLQAALSESSLLFLSYKLHEWDFKVLFQGLTQILSSSLRRFSLLVHPSPLSPQAQAATETVKRYLEAYCETAKFKIVWDDPNSFVQKLWQKWATHD